MPTVLRCDYSWRVAWCGMVWHGVALDVVVGFKVGTGWTWASAGFFLLTLLVCILSYLHLSNLRLCIFTCMLSHVFANFRGNTAASLICCCFGRCPNLSMNRACRSAFDVAPFCFFWPDFCEVVWLHAWLLQYIVIYVLVLCFGI